MPPYYKTIGISHCEASPSRPDIIPMQKEREFYYAKADFSLPTNELVGEINSDPKGKSTESV